MFANVFIYSFIVTCMKNKKIFNIVTEFSLVKKPTWLDSFRKKYDKPYPYHITLKTCTYFNPNKLRNLKQDLSNISRSFKEIRVVFNKLSIKHTSNGGCIMIKAKRNIELSKLKNEISYIFSKYGRHIAKEYQNFEAKFEPHITIARNLTEEQLKNAKRELKTNLNCEAIIKELVLSKAEENTFEEWSNQNNKVRYTLEK